MRSTTTHDAWQKMTADFRELQKSATEKTFPPLEQYHLEYLYYQEFSLKIKILLLGEVREKARKFFEKVLNCLEESSASTPQPLDYVVLPVGERFSQNPEKETDEPKNYTNANPEALKSDHPRTRWAYDMAMSFDEAFDPSQHFMVGLPRSENSAPYHIIIFPSYDRAVFVCDTYANATFVTPRSDWSTIAQSWEKVEALRSQLGQIRGVEFFNMTADPIAWKMKLWKYLRAPHPDHHTQKPITPKGGNIAQNLADLEQFYQTHQRWPKRSNKSEKKLASCIAYIKKLYKDGRLPSDLADKAKSIGLDLKIAEEYRLSELADFYVRHGRWPDGGKNRDQTEQDLARVLSQLGQRFRSGELRQTLIAKIQALGINVVQETTNDREFRQNVQACVEFYKQHQRWPSQSKTNPNEKRLGTFIWTCRRRYRARQGESNVQSTPLPQEQFVMLSNAGIPLDTQADRLHKTKQQAANIAAFIHKNKRKPSLSANDDKEVSLAQTLLHWNQAFSDTKRQQKGQPPIYKNRRLTDTQLDAIKAAGIKLTGSKTRAETFEENFTALVSFYREHKRHPKLGRTPGFSDQEKQAQKALIGFRNALRGIIQRQKGQKTSYAGKLTPAEAQKLHEAGIDLTSKQCSEDELAAFIKSGQKTET